MAADIYGYAVDGYSDFIFINRFGGVQHQGTLNKALRRIIRGCSYEVLDKAKKPEEAVTLPPFSNHSLRHTFTTRMCEAGMNVKAMQKILGHADAEVTMNIYAEATDDFAKTQMNEWRAFSRSNSLQQLTTGIRQIYDHL